MASTRNRIAGCLCAPLALLMATVCPPFCDIDGGEKEKPMLRPFVISAHRAGGRVYAPDNSMPNILFAIQNKVTAIEVDVRETKDGQLVLSHDSSIPRSYLHEGAEGKVAIRSLTADEIRKAHYSKTVGGKLWKDVKFVFAEELVAAAKGTINLQLHSHVPAKRIIQFIRKYKIQKESMVTRGDIGYLKTIHAAEPTVCLEYPDNTLGRRKVEGKWKWYPIEKQYEIYRDLMKKLQSAGIDALCTKGLSKEKVAIGHEFGIMVRTSVGYMKVGRKPDRYIKMGVDYALTDDPLLMMQAVRRLRPDARIPHPGETFYDLIRGPAK